MSDQEFYHGTNAELQPGDHIWADPYAHFTNVEEHAQGYADSATVINPATGEDPKVYRVKPTGPYEQDEHDIGDEPPVSFRSRHPLLVEEQMKESVRKVAHDSGDGETIYHCPFCGSGQVIARSDRSIECEFCHQNFTVQVQPQYPAFPQTIDGMPVDIPGMPGQVNAGDPAGLPPVDPDQVDEEGNVPPEEQEGEEEPEQEEGGNAPPWEKQSFRTTAGRRLAGDDYIRHLAIRYAGDRKHMAARIKEERQG